mgnify:CR=1 FL=1
MTKRHRKATEAEQKQLKSTINYAKSSIPALTCGLITDTGDAERHYIRELQPEKEAAIREALVWFGVIKGK